MKMLILLSLMLTHSVFAVENKNALDELDPRAENIEEVLKQYDAQYELQTGKPSHFEANESDKKKNDCFRNTCRIWAQVSLSEQIMYLWIDGAHYYTWKISSGGPGYSTPTFDTHPNGRIYDAYTSTKFPEGDYMGLGNMPYAVFISGGYAIHGTTQGNWRKLGMPASHGCIRLHPDQAKYFNNLVKANGISNTWITVHY